MDHITEGRKMTVLWLLRILGAAFLLSAVSLELLHVSPLIGILLGASSLASAAFFGCWYLPAYFRRYAAYLEPRSVRIEHGVFSRRTTVLPLEHILTASISSSPLMRLFGLRTVVLGLPSHRFCLYAVRKREAAHLLALCGKGRSA